MLPSHQAYDARKTYRVGDRAVFHGILREAIPKPGTNGRGLLWRKVKPTTQRAYETREITAV